MKRIKKETNCCVCGVRFLKTTSFQRKCDPCRVASKLMSQQKNRLYQQKYPAFILKERIRDREGRQCFICGSVDELIRTKRLQVHHINMDRLNNSDTNLVALCPKCHTDIHKILNKRFYWVKNVPMEKTVPEFTTDWFTKNLPSWVKYILPRLLDKKAPHTLEIGAYEGRSAYFILDAVPETWVTTIDPFTGSGHLPMTDVKERCYKNLKEFGDRVVILDQPSSEVLPAMTPDQFDFVYVDGLHTYESCKFDMENAWPLLKSGGIMCVDDYLWNRADTPSRPKEAIDEFLDSHKSELKMLYKDYQVIVEKI